MFLDTPPFPPPPKGTGRIPWASTTGDVYISTGLFTGNSRKNENIAALNCLFFDLDGKDWLAKGDGRKKGKAEKLLYAGTSEDNQELLREVPEEVNRFFAENGLSPHVVVWSGNGYHIYFAVEVSDEIDAWKAVYRRILNKADEYFFRGVFDHQCVDLGTRVTREPGSMNTKGTPKEVVEVFRAGDAKPLILKEVQDAFPPPAKKRRGRPQRKKRIILTGSETVTFEAPGGAQVTDTVTVLFEQAQEHGKVRCRLDFAGHDGSCSSYTDIENEKLVIFHKGNRVSPDDPNAFKGDDGVFIGIWEYNPHTLDLDIDDEGQIRKTFANLAKIVGRYRPRWWMDTRLGLRKSETTPIGDHDLLKLKFDLSLPPLRLSGDWMSKGQIDDASTFWCAEHHGRDPVKEWVESNRWDGTPRLNSWLERVYGTENDLWGMYGKYAMLAIVRRIYTGDSPVHVRHILSLLGDQYDGKSSLAAAIGAVAHLGEAYFSDAPINLQGTPGDLMQSMRGKIVMELPENAYARNADKERIKAFITQKKDAGRTAYSRIPEESFRQTYFVSTSNRQHPLADMSGSTRFLVVSGFGRLPDWQWLNDHSPQIYAEAYERVVLGNHIPEEAETWVYEGKRVENWNLSRTDLLRQIEENKRFEEGDQTLDFFEDILSTEDEITSRNLRDLIKEHQVKVSNAKLSECMSTLGWERSSTGKVRGWKKHTPPPPTPVAAPPPTSVAAPPPAPVSSQRAFTPWDGDVEKDTERGSLWWTLSALGYNGDSEEDIILATTLRRTGEDKPKLVVPQRLLVAELAKLNIHTSIEKIKELKAQSGLDFSQVGWKNLEPSHEDVYGKIHSDKIREMRRKK